MPVHPTLYAVDPRNYIATPLAIVLRYKTLVQQLHTLYTREETPPTWHHKTTDDIERILATVHTLITACQIDIDSHKRVQQCDVVGFVTLSGDTTSPLLEDIIVRPIDRSTGIGRTLVSTAVAHAFRQPECQNVELYCDGRLQQYYTKQGFQLIRTDENNRCYMRLSKPTDYQPTPDVDTNLQYAAALELQTQQIMQKQLSLSQQQQLAEQRDQYPVVKPNKRTVEA